MLHLCNEFLSLLHPISDGHQTSFVEPAVPTVTLNEWMGSTGQNVELDTLGLID